MADKPPEPTRVVRQDVRKYYAIIASYSLFIACVIFVIYSKEMTVKCRSDKVEFNTEMGDSDRIHIDNILKIISEFEGKFCKKLKMKIEKVAGRLNENLLKNTCDEKESKCMNFSNTFRTMFTEIKKDVKEALTVKLSELEKQINVLSQNASPDSESVRNDLTKTVAQMESRFTTEAETGAMQSNLETSLDVNEAPVNGKHVFSSNETKSTESKSYVQLLLRVSLWTVGFVICGCALLIICFLVGDFRRNGPPKDSERIGAYGVLFSCICVVITEVYFAYMYLMYGREGVFTSSLANLLFP